MKNKREKAAALKRVINAYNNQEFHEFFGDNKYIRVNEKQYKTLEELEQKCKSYTITFVVGEETLKSESRLNMSFLQVGNEFYVQCFDITALYHLYNFIDGFLAINQIEI